MVLGVGVSYISCCEDMDSTESSSEQVNIVCRFCLSEKVPSSTCEATICRGRSPGCAWATDSFVQNAIVPTLYAMRRRFRPKRTQAEEREQEEKAHAMLTPCLCKGSQKYVHYKCLQYWIGQRLSKGVPLSRALKCSVCTTPYSLPGDFNAGSMGMSAHKNIPLHLLANVGQCYFSSFFLLGGIRGMRDTASIALQLAISPLWLFPGLPINVFTQALNHQPEAAQSLALACVGAPLLPAYTKLALQASGFLMLKGYFIGGIGGSLIGGKHLLKMLLKVLNKLLVESPGQSS